MSFPNSNQFQLPDAESKWVADSSPVCNQLKVKEAEGCEQDGIELK